jgi:pyridoxal phosphate enzyme (YggS family)
VSASIDNRRPAELVASLAGVRSHLADAAAAAGRDIWSVTLIAVTKTFPAADIATLLGLGVIDIAESRDQEAREKLAQLRATDPQASRTSGASAIAPEPRLHFVGRLQTNKCRSVARYASCVHTVDRIEVAVALGDGVDVAQRDPLPVFVQVSLDGDPARGGVVIDELPRLADTVAADARLRLLGVMAVAPLSQPPESAYTELAELAALVRQSHPGAVNISAGMSNDYPVAIAHGATHVRIGSALLGHRDATFS